MEKPKYSVHLFAGGGGGILADLLDAAVAFAFGFEIVRVVIEGPT